MSAVEVRECDVPALELLKRLREFGIHPDQIERRATPRDVVHAQAKGPSHVQS